MTTTILSSLSLFPATPEQVIESRRRTAIAWGKDMTLEEYLHRDDVSDTQEHARDGKLITWVLAPRDDPTSLNFVSSCETFRREGLVWRRPPPPPDGEDSVPMPERVTCYGIASVFTPPSLRGNGYAAHMMRLLHWVLAETSWLPKVFSEEWGTPPARVAHAGDGWFSALWSDIGRDFYKRCGPTMDQEGWIVRSPASTVWNVSAEILLSEADPTNWTWLDEAGVLELWEKDADNVAHTLGLPDNYRVSLTFLPNKGVAAFQHQRNIHILNRLVPPIQYWGIMAKHDSQDAILDTFATWSFEVRLPGLKTLIITRLRSRPESFKSLMSTVMAVAKQQGMERVEVYSLPDELQSVAASMGGITFEREEHLPAFKWYGAEKSSEVAWLLNEKFCWC
ncbi:putative expressed protein [Lyophyllum shimeji]|uniref:Expressed protein n=1 Tax=Lyophyllum shimeji TaxID=47721 RepID=A0A9P3UTA0_LYOSH|nr:putative expressed protein [Lyophyllum shimeji]